MRIDFFASCRPLIMSGGDGRGITRNGVFGGVFIRWIEENGKSVSGFRLLLKAQVRISTRKAADEEHCCIVGHSSILVSR